MYEEDEGKSNFIILTYNIIWTGEKKRFLKRKDNKRVIKREEKESVYGGGPGEWMNINIWGWAKVGL